MFIIQSFTMEEMKKTACSANGSQYVFNYLDGSSSGFEGISYHIKQGALRFVVFVAVNEVAKGFFKGI